MAVAVTRSDIDTRLPRFGIFDDFLEFNIIAQEGADGSVATVRLATPTR